jgi:predicted nuclease of predicted toxin-antitoxin system
MRENNITIRVAQMLGENFLGAAHWKLRTEKNPCDSRIFEVVKGKMMDPVRIMFRLEAPAN